MRSDGGEFIKISKRLLTSVVVGAALVLSTVLVVSLIGGDDKPEVTTEKPPADEQPSQDDQDDTADDEPSADDYSSDDTSDSDDASDGDDADLPDGDEGSDDLPDDGDDTEDNSDGKGEKKGQCHRHRTNNAAADQQLCEKNAEEHSAEGDVAAEDDESEEEGAHAGECICGEEGQGKCQSGE